MTAPSSSDVVAVEQRAPAGVAALFENTEVSDIALDAEEPAQSNISKQTSRTSFDDGFDATPRGTYRGSKSRVLNSSDLNRWSSTPTHVFEICPYDLTLPIQFVKYSNYETGNCKFALLEDKFRDTLLSKFVFSGTSPQGQYYQFAVEW